MNPSPTNQSADSRLREQLAKIIYDVAFKAGMKGVMRQGDGSVTYEADVEKAWRICQEIAREAQLPKQLETAYIERIHELEGQLKVVQDFAGVIAELTRQPAEREQ